MIHELPHRVFRSPYGRASFLGVAALFVAVQLGLAVRPALPAPWHAGFPWGMFKDASRDNKTVVAWGYTAEGDRVDIDLTRWFHYTRGATWLRIYDHHTALLKNRSWHRTEQRAFGRWLARRVYVEDGIKLAEVKLSRLRERIDSGKERIQPIFSVAIEPIDYELEIPREARVDVR